MKKPNISKIISSVRTSASKHSPEILTGIGIAGLVVTTVMAVRATPKALILIEDRKKELREDTLTPVETVKAVWICYVPAALTGTVSIACLIGANSVNLRRNAALATAYTLSESALKEYQEKVVETIGEKRSKLFRMPLQKTGLKRIQYRRTKLLSRKRAILFALIILPVDISSPTERKSIKR